MVKTKTKTRAKAAKPAKERPALAEPTLISIDPDELLRIAARKVNAKLQAATEFREVARLSESLASIAHQARQSAKQATRELRAIPLEQIVQYLKTLPEEERADISRELAGVNDEEGLL